MSFVRRLTPGAALVLFLAGSGAAGAHAHLIRSVPTDGSVLTAAPARLTLAFSESARLTALWIGPEGGARRKLTPLPTADAAEISVALPPLEPGRYVLTWRVVGHDGHVVPGQLHFTLRE